MAKKLSIKSDLKAFTIKDFTGLNNNDNSSSIEDNQAQDLLNVICTKEVKKRGGFAKVNSTALSGSTGIFGLGAYYKTGGSSYLLLASHTTIQSIHTGTGVFTSIITGLTTNERTRFRQFKNIAVITKAGDAPYKYNGTTGAVLGGSPPTCPYQAVFKNYHFLAGNSTYPSRLYYSNLDDNETWGASNFYDVYPDDGDIITGLEITFDSLIIFKEYAIYILTGDSPTYTEGLTLWRIDKASTDTGTVAQGSVTTVGKNLIYISRNNGIQTFGGSIATTEGTEVANISSALLSKDITPTVQGLSTTRLNQAEAINWDYKYICAVPNGSSTSNNLNLVYDYAVLPRGCWYLWNIPANCWAIFRTSGADDLYFGSPTTGFIYKYTPDTYSDSGTAINAYYKTKDFNLGSASNDKIFRKFYVTVNNSQDYTLTVDPYIDMATSSAATYTIGAQASDSLWGSLVWGSDWWGAATTAPSGKQIMNSRGKFINYKFSNNTLSQNIRLRDVTQFFRLRGSR